MATIKDVNNDRAIVYDLEANYGLGGTINRREMPHKMKVDIDVRDPQNENGKTKWIYWGSDKSLIKAIKKTCSMVKDNPKWEVRIVESQNYTVILQTTISELRRIC